MIRVFVYLYISMYPSVVPTREYRTVHVLVCSLRMFMRWKLAIGVAGGPRKISFEETADLTKDTMSGTTYCDEVWPGPFACFPGGGRSGAR